MIDELRVTVKAMEPSMLGFTGSDGISYRRNWDKTKLKDIKRVEGGWDMWVRSEDGQCSREILECFPITER